MNPPLTLLIVGWRYVPGARQAIDALPLGSALRLVREPTNQKDKLAVQVWLGERQRLGYVPKASNVEIAWALDGGAVVRAVFAGIGVDREPAMQIILPVDC